VQETWVGFLTGLDRFEGRASLKTWLFRILTNSAKTRAVREGRSVPFSSLVRAETDGDEPAVDPDRFLPADHDRWPGHWATPPRTPEARLLGAETQNVMRRAIDELPEAQRTVITLRDVGGWDAEEVCEVLDLTDGNQRVLLHRARSRVRAALEDYLESEAAAPVAAATGTASSGATST
jgi:RNA polymerase sigma-70 factor, ECF subfamily